MNDQRPVWLDFVKLAIVLTTMFWCIVLLLVIGLWKNDVARMERKFQFEKLEQQEQGGTTQNSTRTEFSPSRQVNGDQFSWDGRARGHASVIIHRQGFDRGIVFFDARCENRIHGLARDFARMSHPQAIAKCDGGYDNESERYGSLTMFHPDQRANAQARYRSNGPAENVLNFHYFPLEA